MILFGLKMFGYVVVVVLGVGAILWVLFGDAFFDNEVDETEGE